MKSALLLIATALLFVSVGTHAAEWNIDNRTNCKAWDDYDQPNRVISRSGKCADGHASGFGTIIWYKDGKETKQYKGEMIRGKHDGKGTFTKGGVDDKLTAEGPLPIVMAGDVREFPSNQPLGFSIGCDVGTVSK